MLSKLLTIAALAAASILPQQLMAQAPVPSGPPAASSEGNVPRSNMALEGGPVDKTGVSAPSSDDEATPIVQLNNEGENFDLAIAYSYSLESSRLVESPSDRYRWANSSTRFSLKGSVPLGNRDQLSAFDFKQVGIGTKATVGFAQSWSSFTKLRSYFATFETALWECARDKNVASWEALRTEYQAAKTTERGLGQTPNVILDLLITENKAARDKLKTECYANGEQEMVETYASDLAAEALRPDGFGTITFLGLDGTVAVNRFEYVDATAFTEERTTPAAFEIAAFAGLVFPDAAVSVKGTLSYARGYEANAEAEICRTVVVTQTCLSGAIGRPTRKESAYASGELRWLLALGADRVGEDGSVEAAPRIAIAPEATIDLETGEWAVDVPIYLRRNKKGVLDGGVRFGYRSDEDDFAVGLFLNLPFPGL